MAKTKKVKKGATKEGYLRHTKFIMGAPSQGGHSKGVLAVYMVDGSRMDFYSKDYKHLMPLFDRFCSFEQYGLPYLRNVWANDGDGNYKFDHTKVQSAIIYPSEFAPNQTPIEVLFKKETPSVLVQKKSTFQLQIPKRLDLQRSANDRFHSIFSKDVYKNGKIDIYESFMSIWNQYKSWENFENSKRSKGRMIIYTMADRKAVAEMDNSCLFFLPYTTQRFAFV